MICLLIIFVSIRYCSVPPLGHVDDKVGCLHVFAALVPVARECESNLFIDVPTYFPLRET
jgi:hypothetical protein